MKNLPNKLKKDLFFPLLLAGVTFSFLARLFLEGARNGIIASLVAILICIFCLALYYQISKRSGAGRHSPDNLYYMGLLFTLASLAYSLITLFLVNAHDFNETDKIHNLIGGFGIALLSTFFGILFRILLLQKLTSTDSLLLNYNQTTNKVSHKPVSGDSSTPESKLSNENVSGDSLPPAFDSPVTLPHQDLQETAFKLRMELTQTIADMQAFRKAINQANNETTQEIEGARTSMIQRMEEATHEQVKVISTLSDGGEKIENAILSILEGLQTTGRNIESTGESVKKLTSEYTALNSNLQQSLTFFTSVESEIEQATKTLTKATNEFSDSLAVVARVTPQYAHQYEQSIAVLRKEAEEWQSMTTKVRSSLIQAIEELTHLIKRD